MPYLEDELAELEENAFDPATDILETFDPSGGEQPGGGETFALDAGEATLVYLVEWGKARSLIRSCLGFSYADSGDPWRLRRENPWTHPRYPWLTAGTIHLSATAPASNESEDKPADPEGAPNYPAVFTDGGPIKTGNYSHVYATVRYVDRPWTFRPDTSVEDYEDELDRNCYFDPAPTVDLIQAEGGKAMMKWNQGRGGADEPLAGNPITNLFATQFSKCVYTLNWMWVPQDYVSDDSRMLFPKHILRCASKVNSTKYAGRPAGTLLCQAPQLQRFRFPVSTFDGLYPFYGWNIKIPLVYLNPERGVMPDDANGNDPDPNNNSIPRGHRLLPSSSNCKWYEAIRGDQNGTHLLLEEDLYKMFKHVNDPRT